MIQVARNYASQNKSITASNFLKTFLPGDTVYASAIGSSILPLNGTRYGFDITIYDGPRTLTKSISYDSDGSATYAEILAGLQSSFNNAMQEIGYGQSLALRANPAGTGLRVDSLNGFVGFAISNNQRSGLLPMAYAALNVFSTTGDGPPLTVSNNTPYSLTFRIERGLNPVEKTITYTSDGSATFAEIFSGLAGQFEAAMIEAGDNLQNRIRLRPNGNGDGIRVDAYDKLRFHILANNIGITNGTYGNGR